jgi:uncharacterized RDD family membrane protein YckC
VSARIPEYEKYTLLDLYQVLNSIRQDLVPHTYEALVKEIDSREPTSIAELEDCYIALDKDRNPEFAARLEEQINALGGFVYARREAITEENKYKTFWRRFWAHFLDGFVVGIPLLILLVILEGAGVIQSTSSPYIDQFVALIGLSYYIVMHAMFGQTAGKMATGVKIYDKSEESDISWKQAVMRDIVPLFFFLVSFVYLITSGAAIGETSDAEASWWLLYAYAYSSLAWYLAEVITMLFNSKRRAVHDFVAGTVVVRI